MRLFYARTNRIGGHENLGIIAGARPTFYGARLFRIHEKRGKNPIERALRVKFLGLGSHWKHQQEQIQRLAFG